MKIDDSPNCDVNSNLPIIKAEATDDRDKEGVKTLNSKQNGPDPQVMKIRDAPL